MWSAADLIVAPATGPGAGCRAVVRLAGDGLTEVLDAVFTPLDPSAWQDRSSGGGRLVPARLAAEGLGRAWGPLPVDVLHWPGPGGPIGGPLAEVQLPASAPLVDALVQEACRLGARLARGGEFTLRAFLAGRLDLVQAEAVLAVVDARSPEALSAALDRLAGGAGAQLRALRESLLDLLADIEAAIDFADETTPDAVPGAGPAAWAGFSARLAAGAAAIERARAAVADRAGTAADLPRVVLCGRPNIGKSALFNALVGRPAALVADEEGTTRDWLEARLPATEEGPGACVLVDLAGLPAAGGTLQAGVEAPAVAWARLERSRADVIVACRDAGSGDEPDPWWPAEAGHAVSTIPVATRCDRLPLPPATGLATSSVTGHGVDELRRAIQATVAALPARGSPATQRLAAGLEAARTALERAAAWIARDDAPDEALVAGHVRSAVDALGEVTGSTLGMDLLDRIFSRHCIGK